MSAEVPGQGIRAQWPHSPSHRFAPGTAYIVTAGTYCKALLFDTPDKRDFLLHSLFAEAHRWGWSLHALAVMANHYHFVAVAPDDATTLRRLVAGLHSRTAVWLNRLDGTPGRRVWFQYWDTCLTYERSSLARLNYVHSNPVKHGLVVDAESYPWCSMGWFAHNAKASFYRTVRSFRLDGVKVEDDF